MSESLKSKTTTDTGVKSRRAQGIPPENSGLSTPKRGGKKQEEDTDTTSGDDDTVVKTSGAHTSEEAKGTAHTTSGEAKGTGRATSASVNTGFKTPAAGSVASSYKTTATSLLRKKKMKLEMEALSELERAEAAFAERELERTKRMINQRLRFNLAQIEEEDASDDSQNLDDDDDDDENERDPNQVVADWMRRNNEPKADLDADKNADNNDMNSKLEKLLARQSVSKDLPTFSGDATQWQLFHSQYSNTTQVCGLTNAENAVRLVKCLQGKARDAVAAMLGVPENVPLVMETLKMTFGRPNKIIKAMLDQIRSISPMQEFDVDDFIHFSNRVQSIVTTMRSLQTLTHLANPGLLEDLLAKIPLQYQMQWCLDTRGNDTVGLEEFAAFLRSTASAASLLPIAMTSQRKDCPQDQQKRENFQRPEKPSSSKSFTPAADRKCNKCLKPYHRLNECPDYLAMSVDDRWNFVKSARRCFICLNEGHQTKECRSKKKCGTNDCKSSHHSTLHSTKSNWVGHTNKAKKFPPPQSKQVLLRMLPVRISGPSGSAEVFALLDDGSTLTLIESDLAASIGLDGDVNPLCLRWTSNVCNNEANSNFDIRGTHENAKALTVHTARTVKHLELPSQSLNFDLMRQTYAYLDGVPFASYVNRQPQILIGGDNTLMIVPRALLHGRENDPVATKTWLGWTVHGNLMSFGQTGFVLTHHSCTVTDEDTELKELIKQTFSTETFGVRSSSSNRSLRSKADERAFEIMKATTKRITPGGRYETGLLWKTDDMSLPESKTMAFNRLRCVERKMDKDESFKAQYTDKIEDYLNKGYAKKLTVEEAKKVTNRTWYIPHFPVTNPNKPGKVRIVFDSAAKSHGMSLNDALLTGPDLYNAIPAIIMRFRQGRYGFTADIAEMFPQIKILEADQQAQRFLWRGSRRVGEPDVCVMTSMIFGATCSPSSAIFTKDLNAEQYADEFPDALKFIKNNMYMDDVLGSMNSEHETLKIIENIIEIHKRGHFNIRNWTCNSKGILSKLPADLVAKDWINLDVGTAMPTERVLGMWWNSDADCFTYRINFHRANQDVLSGLMLPTKRDVLKITSSIYDPLGFIAHFVVKARILFQLIWRSGVQWDDLIPESLHGIWKTWLAELNNITTVKVPRWYFPTTDEPKEIQLHTFVDASEAAFASVSYLRILYENCIHVIIVNGKMRVAPLKPLTIPRLELQGAVLGVRAAATFRDEVQFKIDKMRHWSDSQTVLCWLRSETRRFKVFVANRVGEILEATEVEEWKWIPTDQNPADLATRANKPVDFDFSSTWYQRPEFLSRKKRIGQKISSSLRLLKKILKYVKTSYF